MDGEADDLLAAMTAQTVQRIGTGQGLEVSGVERAAQSQVFGAGEGLLGSGDNNALGG